jgi:ABC-2 type transport system permease protein
VRRRTRSSEQEHDHDHRNDGNDGFNALPRRARVGTAAEWSKLATLRSTYLILGLGLVLSIGTTALVSLALGSTQDTWSADFSPVTTSMVGNIWTLIIYAVFGVLVMSREYSGGLIRLTLSATPRRGRVLAAKLLLVSGITLLFGLLTTVGMFLVGQTVLGAYGMPVANLGDADARRMVLGLGAVMPFFPLVGFALAVIFRSTAGAITAVLGLLWLPEIFGNFLLAWWQEHVLSLLPSNAMDSFTLAHIEPSATDLDPVLGAVVAGVWLMAGVGAAYLTLVRRDA